MTSGTTRQIQSTEMGGTGLELDDVTTCARRCLRSHTLDCAVKCAASDVSSLEEIASSWLSLTDSIRSEILRLSRSGRLIP